MYKSLQCIVSLKKFINPQSLRNLGQNGGGERDETGKGGNFI